MMILSPATSTFSTGMRVSVPSLISEPVKVFTHSPRPTAMPLSLPAGRSASSVSSLKPSLQVKAYPSIAEVARAG